MNKSKLKQGYKQSDVGIIPEDWDIRTLEDVCVPSGLVRGPFGGALKKEFFVEKGYKVYEQRNAIYRDSTIGNYYIDNSKFQELKRFEVKERDFIVSCSGTIGRIYQIPKAAATGVINQALLKIKTDDKKIVDKFFFYYFDWDKFQTKIIDNTQGGAMPNLVGMNIFRETLIPTPPLPEQQAIAEVLSEVDALITSLDQLIAKKRNIKQGAMQLLLTGKKRLAGFSGEWETKQFGEIANLSKNFINPLFAKESFPCIELEHLSQETGRLLGLIESKNQLSQKAKFSKGDVLFGKLRPYLKKFLYADFDGVCSTEIWVISTLGKVLSDFIFYIVQSDRFIETANQSTGTKMPRAEWKTVKETEFSIPPTIEEQKAIVQILSDMDAEIKNLEIQRDKYKNIKQGMLQELLTGKTRLVKPDTQD